MSFYIQNDASDYEEKMNSWILFDKQKGAFYNGDMKSRIWVDKRKIMRQEDESI